MESFEPHLTLIGLAGYPRAGKDTAKDLLGDLVWGQYRPFIPHAFADPMREIARCFWGDVREYRKKYPEEYRSSMQELGQFVRDNWAFDFWVKLADKKYRAARKDAYPGPLPIMVVSDVRYPNELDWIRSWGGQLWWIERAGVGTVNNHQSEQHYDYLRDRADFHINNPGTIEGFAAALRHRVRRAPTVRDQDSLLGGSGS